MKLEVVNGRYIVNMTRYEALLVKDAVYDFQNNRSETQSWDSLNDPILVSQMLRTMDKIE